MILENIWKFNTQSIDSYFHFIETGNNFKTELFFLFPASCKTFQFCEYKMFKVFTQLHQFYMKMCRKIAIVINEIQHIQMKKLYYQSRNYPVINQIQI